MSSRILLLASYNRNVRNRINGSDADNSNLTVDSCKVTSGMLH